MLSVICKGFARLNNWVKALPTIRMLLLTTVLSFLGILWALYGAFFTPPSIINFVQRFPLYVIRSALILLASIITLSGCCYGFQSLFERAKNKTAIALSLFIIWGDGLIMIYGRHENALLPKIVGAILLLAWFVYDLNLRRRQRRPDKMWLGTTFAETAVFLSACLLFFVPIFSGLVDSCIEWGACAIFLLFILRSMALALDKPATFFTLAQRAVVVACTTFCLIAALLSMALFFPELTR